MEYWFRAVRAARAGHFRKTPCRRSVRVADDPPGDPKNSSRKALCSHSTISPHIGSFGEVLPSQRGKPTRDGLNPGDALNGRHRSYHRGPGTLFRFGAARIAAAAETLYNEVGVLKGQVVISNHPQLGRTPGTASTFHQEYCPRARKIQKLINLNRRQSHHCLEEGWHPEGRTEPGDPASIRTIRSGKKGRQLCIG